MGRKLTPKEFTRAIRSGAAELRDFSQNEAPRVIAKKAEDLYRGNFRKGGFQDGEVQTWVQTQRQKEGGRRAGNSYTPLLSRRADLMRSVKGSRRKSAVAVSSDKEYAGIHNEGGEFTARSRVTPKMRRFAWAMHYKNAGRSKKKRREHTKWSALALTKKSTIERRVKMPQRKFIGNSKDLDAIVIKLYEDKIRSVLNQ